MTTAAHALALHRDGNTAEAVAILDQLPRTVDTVAAIGVLADDAKNHQAAISLWLECMHLDQSSPYYACRFLNALNNSGRNDQALAGCKEAIRQFPEDADLHNLMGVLTQDKSYLLRAVELNPMHSVAMNNLANHDGEDSEYWLRRAIEAYPDLPNPHIPLAQTLFMRGENKEAWKHYEYRLQIPHFCVKIKHDGKRWNGEPLVGQSITLFCEQGIGDVCMFLTGIEAVRCARAVQVLVDGRMVASVRRALPWCDVQPYVARRQFGAWSMEPHYQTDYWAPVGDLWKYSIKRGACMAPDDDRVQDIWESLPCKEVVGVCWRSGVSGRDEVPGVYWARNYVRDNPRTAFVNLQYNAREDELEIMNKLDNFRSLDIDLFNDIDGNLAIIANCDHVIGPATAPMMFALASGANVRLVGDIWWRDLYGADNLTVVDQ